MHGFGSAQPAEAVADGSNGFFVALPERGVFCPEALGEVLLRYSGDSLADGGGVGAERGGVGERCVGNLRGCGASRHMAIP